VQSLKFLPKVAVFKDYKYTTRSSYIKVSNIFYVYNYIYICAYILLNIYYKYNSFIVVILFKQ